MSMPAAPGRRAPLGLCPGYPPWHPCPGCVRLLVFGYDRGAPVDGIFLYGEHQQYLFTRVRFDALAGAGQYAYVRLSRRMLRRLQHTSGGAYAGLRGRCLAARRGVSYASVSGAGDAQQITGPAAPPEQAG
jgi:hypothetical protein